MKKTRNTEAVHGKHKDSPREDSVPEKTSWMRGVSPLVFFASLLSCASLVWTTVSVTDLLGIGPLGLTVAGSLDIVWAAILYAEYQQIPLVGSGSKGRMSTAVVGWIALTAVIVLLFWHGQSLEGTVFYGTLVTKEMATATAVAGPLLPLGAKVVWLLAIGRHRDPARPTPEDEDEMAEAQRLAAIAARKAEMDEAARRRVHEAEMRQREEELEAKRAEARIKEEERNQRHEEEMAELRAKMEREAAQRKAKADAKMDETRTQAEIERERARTMFEIDIERVEMQEELRRRQPLIISGRVEPPALEAAPTASSSALRKTRKPRTAVTAYVDGGSGDLSQARRTQKVLAAAFYLAREAAVQEGLSLSQAEFGRRVGKSSVAMSRALTAWPPDVLKAEDYEEAQKFFENGEGHAEAI